MDSSHDDGLLDQPTQVYREGKARPLREDPRRLIKAALVTCAMGASGVMFVAIAEWLRPFMPMMIYVGGVLPIFLYLMWQLRAENIDQVKRFLLYAALISLPLVAWNNGHYRGALFAASSFVLPHGSWLTAAADRSDRVAAMACGRVLKEDAMALRARVIPTMEFRPAMAQRCLADVSQTRPAMARALSSELIKRWYRDIMTSETIPIEHGCAVSSAMHGVAGHMDDMDGAPYLLNCALASVQPGIMECCGAALGTSYPASSRPDVQPDFLASEMRLSLFVNLTRAMDAPTDKLLSEDVSNSAMGWPPSTLMHWTTTLGCHLVAEVAQPERIAAQLARVTHAQCGLDVENTLYSFESTRLIRRTCLPVTERQWDGQVDLYKWCESARTAAQQTALESASFIVGKGVSVHSIEALTLAIEAAGHEAATRDGFTVEMFNDFHSPRPTSSDVIASDRPNWLELSAKDQAGVDRARRQQDLTLPSFDGNVSDFSRRGRQKRQGQGPTLGEINEDRQRALDRRGAQPLR